MRRKNRSKAKLDKLRERKAYAHDLIYEIRMYRVPTNRVYTLLREKLGCPVGMEHLGTMLTLERVEQAIIALEEIRETYEKRWKARHHTKKKQKKPVPPTPSVKKIKHNQTLPQELLLAATKRAAHENELRRKHPRLFPLLVHMDAWFKTRK
jgi:hypothetical protein